MKLKYVKVSKNNLELAYNIQKSLFPNDPDYNNYVDKIKNCKKDNVAFIVYCQDVFVGIVGIHTEDCDCESLWLDWFGVLDEYRNNGIGKKILLDIIEYCKKLTKYEYLRLDTEYWKGRPAIKLYDSVMTFKEAYTIEDTDDIKYNYWIYTYSLKGKKKLWDNRFLGLSQYYKNLE